MRGSFRSRRIGDLVAEARRLEENGVQELVLIAQDTTRYGEDLGIEWGLRKLIEAEVGIVSCARERSRLEDVYQRISDDQVN